jgi:hypothetical protein
MTHPRMSLLGVPTLVAALAGCATPPVAEGGMMSFPSQASAPATRHPGPGWLLLGSNEEGALYMHPRSTLRIGSSAFIMLVGSKRQPVVLPSGVSVGSVRERIEIDCDRRRFRRHDGTAHPDPVGLGPVLGQVGQQEQWRGVNPNTVMAAVASAVCAATAPNAAPPNVQGAPPEPALPRFPRTRRGTFST